MHDTLELQESSLEILLTRLSLSLVFLSRKLQLVSQDVLVSHHISMKLLPRIQFDLSCFRSTLVTASHLFSFPAGTKMFQFPALPFSEENNSGIPGSKIACISPRLIAACHALHQRLSLVIPYTAYRILLT